MGLLLFATAALAGPTGVHPLDGVDFDLPHDDLAPLGDLVGDAAIVGLGETIHTSGGYYDAKVRVFRYLVEAHGFRVLAMETPWVDAERAGDYVRTCEGDPAVAATSVFGVFADISTARVLEWMCGWNRDHPDDPVHFVGFDIQQGWDDGRLLRALLREHAPGEATERAVDDFGACAGASMTQAEYREWIREHARHPDDARHARCIRGLDAVEALLPTLPEAPAAWAALHARGLRAWEHEVHRRQRGDLVGTYEARDEGMADTLLAMRPLRFPGARVVVWAHNRHIALRGEQIGGVAGHWRSMGSWLRERLGEAWRPVALLAWDADIDWLHFPDPPPARGRRDLARLLERRGHAFQLVDLRDRSVLRPDRPYRIGNDRMIPADQFVAAIYLRASRPMVHASAYGLPVALGSKVRLVDDAWEMTLAEGIDASAALTAFDQRLGARGWEQAERAGARATWERHGRTYTVEIDDGTARLVQTPPEAIHEAAELAAAVGRTVYVVGTVRRADERTLLELHDGARVPVDGDPWTPAWSRRIDAPVWVECLVDDDRLRDCDHPIEHASRGRSG